ncbi:MAG: hypothetical protein BWY09_03128 [Candidatus Hydrogenedentes bacterium ADurb.Bin179]|nr:MAG: hypothetical protein BWY09_03128 [Candidatus Hydrogenedentes bacterium ADurb.Bin179]
MESAQPFTQVLAYLRVKRSEGFIQQQHPGFDGKGPRQGDALPLATRKLGWIAIPQVLQLNQLQQLRNFTVNGLTVGARSSGQGSQSEGNIIEYRHMPKQGVMLKNKSYAPVARIMRRDVFIIQAHLYLRPRIGGIQPGNNPEQRRFP